MKTIASCIAVLFFIAVGTSHALPLTANTSQIIANHGPLSLLPSNPTKSTINAGTWVVASAAPPPSYICDNAPNALAYLACMCALDSHYCVHIADVGSSFIFNLQAKPNMPLSIDLNSWRVYPKIG